MRILTIILWVVLAVFLVWVAISNRTPVIVGLSWTTIFIETTVYQVFFAGIVFGLVCAGIATGWLRLKSFTRRRQAERRADALERDMDTLSEDALKATSEASHRGADQAARALEGGHD